VRNGGLSAVVLGSSKKVINMSIKKQVGSGGNVRDLYSTGDGFESMQEYQLFLEHFCRFLQS
jgi:hypothetical protein